MNTRLIFSTASCLIALCCANVQAQWTGASSGTSVDPAHAYLDATNWLGGSINDTFANSLLLSADTAFHFNGDRTTGAGGLNFVQDGAYNLTLRSDSVSARVLTLGGNVTLDSVADGRTVTIGDALNQLSLALNGSRAFNIAGNDRMVLVNALTGAAGDALTKNGTGLLSLEGTSTFGGAVTINGGALRAAEGVGLSAASNLLFNGGVLETSGTISRVIGTTAGRLQWALSGAGGGFSAFGGELTVDLIAIGGGGVITWAAGTGAPSNAIRGDLRFSSAFADSTVNWVAPIAFSATAGNRVINVADGSAAVDARLTSTISGSLGNSRFIKSGGGTLELLDLADFNLTNRDAQVQAGRLIFKDDGAASGGTFAWTVFNDAVLRLDDTGTQNTNRLRDDAPVFLRGGGILEYWGNASAPSVETLKVQLGGSESGAPSIIRMIPGSDVQLFLGSLGQDFARSSGGTLRFEGAVGATSNQIHVRAAATGLSSRDGVASPWATFQTGTTTNWVAYTAASGESETIKAFTGYSAGFSLADTENAQVNGGAGPLIGPEIANTLRLTPTGAGQALNLGGQVLTLSAGGLLFTGGNDYSISNGQLSAAPDGELVVHVLANRLSLPTTTITSGGLTKNGTGTLVLGAASPLAGPLAVNQGTLDLNGNGGSIGVLMGAGIVTNSGANLTLTTTVSGDTTFFNGALQDGAGTIALSKAGAGTLEFGGPTQSHGGGTMITSGTIRYDAQAPGTSFGSAALTLAGGTFELGNLLDQSTNNVWVPFDAATGLATGGLSLNNKLVVTANSTFGTVYGGGTSSPLVGTVLGDVDLRAQLSLTSGSTGTGGGLLIGGTLTLFQDSAATLRLRSATSHSATEWISGKVTDGPGIAANPLHLVATTRALSISNPSNDYAGGTIIESGAGTVAVTAPARLGLGDVTVASGGRLSLTADTNLGPSASLTHDGTVLTLNYGTAGVTLDGRMHYNLGGAGPITIAGTGNTALILKSGNTSTGKLTLSNGVLDIDAASGLPAGNLEVAAAATVLFENWADFAASRSGGMGTGPAQWQWAGGPLGARGAEVMITNTPATPSFDRNFTLGSTLQVGGHFYANAPLNIATPTVLTAVRTTTVAITGSGLTGNPANAVFNRISGGISGTAVPVFTSGGTASDSAIAEVVLGGSGNAWTGTPVALFSNSYLFNAGIGGLLNATGTSSTQNGNDVYVRFEGDASLPVGDNDSGTPAYLASLRGQSVGGGRHGILLTAKPGGEVYDLPAGYRFVIGGIGNHGRSGVFGSSSATGTTGGSATLRNSDVVWHWSAFAGGGDTIQSTRPLDLFVRDGALVLGTTGSGPNGPVRFIPGQSTDFTGTEVTALTDDTGNTRTNGSSETTNVRVLMKRGEGTLALGNVNYTTLDGSVLNDQGAPVSARFSWQLGRGDAANTGANAYFDGAVRGRAEPAQDSSADGSNSLNGFHLALRGGVYEVDANGAAPRTFNRSVSATVAAGNVNWGSGGGGFAAFGGNVKVDLSISGSGLGTRSNLIWSSTGGFLTLNEPLILGSTTANAVLEWFDNLSLGATNVDATREIRVIDNPTSASDWVEISGSITQAGGTGTRRLIKTGSGILVLTGFTNNYNGLTDIQNGTLLLNGAISAGAVGADTVTVETGGILGGKGTIARPVIVDGILSPGEAVGAINTLSTGPLILDGGSTFQLQLDTTSNDRVQVTGTAGLGGTGHVALDITLNADPAELASYVIINNDGSDAFAFGTNLFAYHGTPLFDGTVFLVSSGAFTQPFQIDYTYDGGADGQLNDVAIIAVPEPGSAALLVAGLCGLALRRRKPCAQQR